MDGLTLRRVRPDDADAVARMMADPAVYGGVMQMPYADADYWRTRLTDPAAAGKVDLHLVAELGGELVGSAGLFPVSTLPRRRHVLGLGITVAAAHQGQGVGAALMGALCDYADRWVAALRIELTVYADNARAITLYRRFGFEVEGTHRGYALRDGAYADVLAMARLHPAPPLLQPAQAPLAPGTTWAGGAPGTASPGGPGRSQA